MTAARVRVDQEEVNAGVGAREHDEPVSRRGVSDGSLAARNFESLAV
jgi:hypothetical protein